MVGESPLIAVVDDEESVRKALSRLFAAVGWQSTAFRSGEEFFASLEVRAPDCILLDLQMPGMSGFEVQEQLLLRNSTIPVVVLTGHDEIALCEQRLATGLPILRKPVHAEVLLETMRQVLFGARLATEKDVLGSVAASAPA